MKAEEFVSIERRIERLDRTGEGSLCWIWTGTFNGNTAIIKRGGRRVTVRRYLYSKNHDIDSKKRLRVRCGQKDCVNPNHCYIAE